MPLASSRDILMEARKNRYGVLSLLGGNMEMAMGMIKAAEEKRAPLILVYNEDVTPEIPMELGIPLLVNAAQRASVPVATILDHGRDLEHTVRAAHLGSSSVMFDGSSLPYEENVARTKEIVRVAHAVGVSVEAELGSIAGSAVSLTESGPQAAFTDPDVAADFVARTGVDTLAISFGNVHGVYRGEPKLDLDRVRQIHARVDIPLAMHGASGLAEEAYGKVIESGISKVCYYTASGIGASNDLKRMLAEADWGTTVYHNIISRSINYFYEDTKRLIELVGCAGVAKQPPE
jgi:fructose-bisphosphate aldolase class II